MSHFLGFDVAKSKLDYSLINEQGKELDHGTIANESLNIATFLCTMVGAYSNIEIICVTEATGGYQDELTDVCRALEITCFIYNPIITKQQIKATVRGKKTDRNDAFLIARVGWSGDARLHMADLYPAMRYFARSCQRLSTLSDTFKKYHVHLLRVLDGELSPETLSLLKNIECAIAATAKQLEKDLARSSTCKPYQLMKSIKGVGPQTAAVIVGEVQDMRRFKTGKALIAFAGLDPKIRQSGKALNSTGRLTKRGSSYLRRNLFLAANTARQYDPQFKALYEKKRTEGKSYTTTICIVARKLLLVARSVWLSGEPYRVPEIK